MCSIILNVLNVLGKTRKVCLQYCSLSLYIVLFSVEVWFYEPACCHFVLDSICQSIRGTSTKLMICQLVPRCTNPLLLQQPLIFNYKKQPQEIVSFHPILLPIYFWIALNYSNWSVSTYQDLSQRVRENSLVGCIGGETNFRIQQ